MRYYIVLEQIGAFPGSPDKERYEVPESVYDLMRRALEVMSGKNKGTSSIIDAEELQAAFCTKFSTRDGK